MTTCPLKTALQSRTAKTWSSPVLRGRALQKQGSHSKLLEDARHITSEARGVSELELEAQHMAYPHYKINALIAIGTCMALLYSLPEITNGFFGFYHYPH